LEKDTDLDALRKRPAFVALLEKVRAESRAAAQPVP